jgi:uncharacterized protein YndB with AHSA1/START domain
MPTPNDTRTSHPTQELVIARTFDAPRTLVFRAFAEAERLAQWWGPSGSRIQVLALDFRPGGVFHFRMDLPDGGQMWGRFTYREIVAPERIVWINAFSDAEGNLVRAPFDESLPLEIRNTVTLDERDGRTTLTLRSVGLAETGEERAAFEGLFDSMRQGYGGTWDQLAAYLAKERRRA